MAASDILFTDVSKLLFSDVRNLLKVASMDRAGKDVAAWLTGIKDAPPEKVALELAERLTEALAHEQDLRKRLTMLVSCEEAATSALTALELATETASLPLPAAAKQSAVAADSLLKVLATDYAGLAVAIQAGENHPDAKALLQLTMLHAMQTLARRELLAYRGHAVPSQTSWNLMRDVYVLARGQGMATAEQDQPSVEREYAATLLFALADPGRLPRSSLAATHAFIAGLAPRARIEAATTAEAGDNTSGRFLLIADKGRPAQPLANVDQDKAQDGLVLDCSAIIPEIERLIAAGAEAAPVPLETLRLLHNAWSAAATAPRRFSRTQFKPRIDMITGLPAILRLLSGRTLGRRQSDDAHGDEQDASEWLVINESPDGFGIQHLSGEAPALDIGDLVLLRPREHGKIHICLVRRSNHAGREHLELGVQLLSSNAYAIPLPSEDILALGQQGLLLSQLPAFGNASGIIIAAGALTPQSVVTDNQAGTLKYYRLGSRIATSTAIEFHLLQSA